MSLLTASIASSFAIIIKEFVRSSEMIFSMYFPSEPALAVAEEDSFDFLPFFFLLLRLLAFYIRGLLAFWMFRMIVVFGLRCVCLRFIMFYVVRLLAFSPLVCGLGTLFVKKKEIVIFFG